MAAPGIVLKFKLPSQREFNRLVMTSLASELNGLVLRAQEGIRASVSLIIRTSFQSSPTYTSLLNDSMWHIMGLEQPEQTLRDIVEEVVRNIECEVTPVRVVGSNLRGGITIRILRSDFSDILGLDASTFISERGHRVDWLEWLLTKGTGIVLGEYTYIPKPDPDHRWSRTGLGIMVKSARGWTVPPEHAGTIDDNWMTRALATTDTEILQVIQREIERNL